MKVVHVVPDMVVGALLEITCKVAGDLHMTDLISSLVAIYPGRLILVEHWGWGAQCYWE
jgi:hypothetical protein